MSIVSVIVPIFNADQYLAACIESLIHQSYRELEIILVNDGSTDDSLSIAQRYAMQDTRIQVFSQDNQGQGAARNVGTSMAHGEYIMYVDADDSIGTDYVAEYTASIGQMDVIQGGYKRVGLRGEVLAKKRPRHFYQFTSPCMRLYRHEWLHSHQLSFPEGMIYEDVLFSLSVWAHHPNYTMLNNTDYLYLLNPLSTTARPNKQARQRLYKAVWQHSAPLWLKVYTLIRLKIHFIL